MGFFVWTGVTGYGPRIQPKQIKPGHHRPWRQIMGTAPLRGLKCAVSSTIKEALSSLRLRCGQRFSTHGSLDAPGPYHVILSEAKDLMVPRRVDRSVDPCKC